MPYFEVSDPEKVVGEASALGAETFVPPTELPETGTFAVLRDPQGAVFGIIRTKRTA
jgi:predicted enzyme related to lactoylglutathione lyase